MNGAWDNFEAGFLNANSWVQRKDGFPSDLLDALSPEEKAKAEDILFNRLDGRDDWPLRAMGHLSVARSVVRLRELLGNKMPTIRATAATAIYKITGDSDMEAIVADIAQDTSLEWMFRLDAVICLSEFQTDSAQQVLSALESDQQYLIAYNAKRMRRN
jgi:hypothetical protein